jgi:hypothetical protein
MFRGIKWLQRLYRLRGSQVSKGACRLKRIPISERFSWIKGRGIHSKGVPPEVQVGERHLLGLTGKYHGLRRPGRRFRGRSPLGYVRHPWRIHLFQ